MNTHGIKYFNLFEFLKSKAADHQIDGVDEISEKEMRDALDVLEEDGFVTRIGHKKAPTIRFCHE